MPAPVDPAAQIPLLVSQTQRDKLAAMLERQYVGNNGIDVSMSKDGRRVNFTLTKRASVGREQGQQILDAKITDTTDTDGKYKVELGFWDTTSSASTGGTWTSTSGDATLYAFENSPSIIHKVGDYVLVKTRGVDKSATPPTPLFTISGPAGDQLLAGKVTAVASTSDAPPLKYTVGIGHWDSPTSTSQGTWVDDSVSVTAYGQDPGMIPQIVDRYVRLELRGTDSGGSSIYSILGVAGQFICYLTKVGGADGDDITEPSYTYDVYTDSGKTVKIGSALSPQWGRNVGSFSEATQGIAFIDTTATTVLFQVDETEQVCT